MNNGILLHCCSNSHVNLDMDTPWISTPELVLLLSWTVFIWGWPVSFHLSKHQINMLQRFRQQSPDKIWWKCHVSASNSTQMLLWKNPNHHWCDAATHLVRNSLLSIKLTGFDTERTTAARIHSTRFTWNKAEDSEMTDNWNRNVGKLFYFCVQMLRRQHEGNIHTVPDMN